MAPLPDASGDPARILVLGSVNMDLVIRGPRLPRPGETVLGGEFYRAEGEKGANQAVAAARAAQVPVALIATVGDDDFGRQLRMQLSREAIRTDFVKVAEGQPTGAALILVGQSGENLISVASGANWHLTPRDVDLIPASVFASATVFLTCLESPVETVVRGLRRAKEAGALVLLNPAPASPEINSPEILGLVDVLTPNAGETEMLTGIQPVDDASAERAGRALQRMGCRKVVMTLGARGAIVIADEVTMIPGHPVDAVDTTAAGDAFNGALAAALAEGKSLIQAARWANCAAAIAVTRRGAQPSLPTRAEIESFADSGDPA